MGFQHLYIKRAAAGSRVQRLGGWHGAAAHMGMQALATVYGLLDTRGSARGRTAAGRRRESEPKSPNTELSLHWVIRIQLIGFAPPNGEVPTLVSALGRLAITSEQIRVQRGGESFTLSRRSTQASCHATTSPTSSDRIVLAWCSLHGARWRPLKPSDSLAASGFSAASSYLIWARPPVLRAGRRADLRRRRPCVCPSSCPTSC